LTTFLRASGTTKYAVASISGWLPVDGNVHLDRQVDAWHSRGEAGPQTALGENRGQGAMGQFAQLGVALLCLLERLSDEWSASSSPSRSGFNNPGMTAFVKRAHSTFDPSRRAVLRPEMRFLPTSTCLKFPLLLALVYGAANDVQKFWVIPLGKYALQDVHY
jgi:hypothetical protein